VNELALASGPACGAALFVALAGGRLPRAGVPAPRRAFFLRWLGLGGQSALEEVVWRGLVLSALALALGPVWALLLSSAAFAAWHAPCLGRRCMIHAVTGGGFGLAFLAGGLLAAVLAHCTYNVLVDWAVHARRART
jgi:membrane protease YdiL (CAAX protease family)